MILDRLDNIERYATAHPGFPAAFRWLGTVDVRSLPTGRTEIAGDRLYASVMREPGHGQAGARFETHRRYIDIQYLAAGSDLMGWTHATPSLASLGYDAARDLEFYADPVGLWIPVPAGHFVVFFPEDAHAPMAGTGPMVKVVIKVAV